MNPLPVYTSLFRFPRSFCFLVLLWFVFPCVRAGAGEAQVPPDAKDIGTGEIVPGAKIVQTKDFGAVVSDKIQLPMDYQGEVLPGDVILAVDGLRTYGWAEFQIARFAKAPATTMTLLINRQGNVLSVTLDNLPASRDFGLKFDTSAEQKRILDALASAGIPVTDEVMRVSLCRLPGRAAADLDAWSKQFPATRDTAWFPEFINLYAAIINRKYADAHKPGNEPPIPYFTALERFYLALAAQNKTREIAPDPGGAGVSAEFYVIAMPVPDFIPSYGDIKFPDQKFQDLLIKKRFPDGPDDPDRAKAARGYSWSGSDNTEIYFNQIKSALLEENKQGGWPYRSELVYRRERRDPILLAFSEHAKDQNDPDWIIYAFGTAVLKYMDGETETAASLIDDIGKRSPKIARDATNSIYGARKFTKSDWKSVEPVRKVFEKNGFFLGPDAPESYRWVLQRVWPVAIATREAEANSLAGPFHLLTTSPYAQLLVLKGLPPPAAASPAR